MLGPVLGSSRLVDRSHNPKSLVGLSTTGRKRRLGHALITSVSCESRSRRRVASLTPWVARVQRK